MSSRRVLTANKSVPEWRKVSSLQLKSRAYNQPQGCTILLLLSNIFFAMSTLMYDWVFSMTSGATLRHILSKWVSDNGLAYNFYISGIFYLKSVPKSGWRSAWLYSTPTLTTGFARWDITLGLQQGLPSRTVRTRSVIGRLFLLSFALTVKPAGLYVSTTLIILQSLSMKTSC